MRGRRGDEPFDVEVSSEGSVVTVYLRTDRAREFARDHVHVSDWSRFGGSMFAVDWRMIGPILEAVAAEGLSYRTI